MFTKQRVSLLALLAATALAGCADITTTDIDVVDRSVFLPSGRVSVDISPRVDNPSTPHTGHAIEFGITGGSGDDKQELNTGASPVIFGGQTFSAPNSLSHEFDFRFAQLAYRYRHFFGAGSFGIEGLGGLGFAEYDLTVSSLAGQRAQEKLSNGGLVGGFGVVWKFWPTTSLQSRITVFGSGDDEGVTAASSFELYVVQALGRHAALRAGLAAWSVVSDREWNDDAVRKSPIRSRFSGPALGLEVMF